jgi:hypothetical protein
MKLKQNMWAIPAMRLGATINGNRTNKATRVEKHIVPKSVVVEWWSAADIMAFDDVVGIACRWKYHWDTVAAEVALEKSLMLGNRTRPRQD